MEFLLKTVKKMFFKVLEKGRQILKGRNNLNSSVQEYSLVKNNSN